MLHDNETKAAARRETVIEPYRQFVASRISAGTCYVTLAFADWRCAEVEQLVAADFVSDCQVVGISSRIDIVKACKKLHPTANFLHGDWIRHFHTLVGEGVTPAVVYLDTLAKANGRSTAIRMAASTLNLLADRVRLRLLKGPTLVTVNVVRKRAGREYAVSPNTFPKLLGPRIKKVNRAFIQEPRPECYTYTQDVGKPFVEQTVMSSYLFLVGRKAASS